MHVQTKPGILAMPDLHWEICLDLEIFKYIGTNLLSYKCKLTIG